MRPLRILVAPSGYKECLLADAVARAIAAGIRRACPEARVTELPLVDGGEGFATRMAAVRGGTLRPVPVTGPLGHPVRVGIGWFADPSGQPVAVIGMAAAAGLRLVPAEARDPLRTTTAGVGEMIRAALDGGARRILLGCGDSGTCDGGAGMAAALGIRFLDRNGAALPPGGGALAELHRIDLSGRDPRLDGVRIEVACNATIPLLGPDGAARRFGPQKGGTPEGIARLEAGLARLAFCLARDGGAAGLDSLPGAGASGGLGAGLHALLGARLRPWQEVTLPALELDAHLAAADLVLTAEGAIDASTVPGKIPAELCRRARPLGLPVIALAGTLAPEARALLDHGAAALFSSLVRPGPLEAAMGRAPADLEFCAEQAMRAVLLGRRLALRAACAA